MNASFSNTNEVTSHLNTSSVELRLHQPNLCLFGGTFNPPHQGHAMIIQALLALPFEKILVMPCYASPHKHADIADHHRLAMLQLFMQQFADPRLQLSTYEIDQQRTTYTHETIAHFRQTLPETQLYFACGSDSLADLVNWEGADYIRREVIFVLANRQSAQIPENSGQVIELGNHFYDVSSTELRKLPEIWDTTAHPEPEAQMSQDAHAGQTGGDHLMDNLYPAVAHYIREHQLYAQPNHRP